MRVLRETKPRAFLIENVVGLTFKRKDEGLKLLKDTVTTINRDTGTRYSLNWKVLNAADYGVPQVRERVFIVGARDGREFKFPAPSHAAVDKRQHQLLDQRVDPWTTAWDAIGDISDSVDEGELEVGGEWGDLLPSIPEGENYLWHTDRKGGKPLFGWRRRFWTFLLKLAKDRPSWIIQSQPGSATGPFHWHNRRLSTRAHARCAGSKRSPTAMSCLEVAPLRNGSSATQCRLCLRRCSQVRFGDNFSTRRSEEGP
jgi:DNA (cytosine-5)-methyltransferase 1